jgi:hypothetical protein
MGSSSRGLVSLAGCSRQTPSWPQEQHNAPIGARLTGVYDGVHAEQYTRRFCRLSITPLPG